MIEKTNTIILIPAYRPSPILVEMCSSLLRAGFPVMVVNDGSGDGYAGIFDSLPSDVTLLTHDVNCGKGKALKTGLQYIKNDLSDIAGVITADADGQHSVEDIKSVFQTFQNNKTSIVLGSRDFSGKIPFKSKFGNTLTRFVFAAIAKTKVYDTQTGLRAFSMQYAADLINLEGDRYEFEINMLLWAAKQKIRMIEVPIKTVYYDGNSASSFNPFRDSFLIYVSLLKFGLSSFVSFLADFALLFVFRALYDALPSAEALFWAAVSARAISSFFNFLMNKNLVFASKERFWVAFLKYYLLVGIILVANYGLLYLQNIWIGLPLWIAKIITELILFPVSYLIQHSFIFKCGTNSSENGGEY
jgi:glycosyltransferase involved in cell wall biosynthesis